MLKCRLKLSMSSCSCLLSFVDVQPRYLQKCPWQMLSFSKYQCMTPKLKKIKNMVRATKLKSFQKKKMNKKRVGANLSSHLSCPIEILSGSPRPQRRFGPGDALGRKKINFGMLQAFVSDGEHKKDGC